MKPFCPATDSAGVNGMSYHLRSFGAVGTDRLKIRIWEGTCKVNRSKKQWEGVWSSVGMELMVRTSQRERKGSSEGEVDWEGVAIVTRSECVAPTSRRMPIGTSDGEELVIERLREPPPLGDCGQEKVAEVARRGVRAKAWGRVGQGQYCTPRLRG